MNKLTMEFSHKELMGAWAPLADASLALDRLHCGDAGGTFGFIDEKVKRALEPLEELIDRIEKENPEQFG